MVAIIPLAIFFALILTKVSIVYAIGAMLGFIVLVLTLLNTDWGIYILIFSMLLSPEIGARGTQGEGVTIRIDDILLTVLIFTWLVKMAYNQELGLFRKTPLNVPMALYSFICIISTGAGMIRGDVGFASGFFFVLKYIEYFLFYFMVVNHVTTKKQVENYYKAIIITYFIVTLVAYSQIPSGERLTAPFEGQSGEPNTLGGYLLLIISVNLSVILTPGIIEQRWMKRTLLVVTAMSVVPLLLTNSRGSWLATIPVIIAYMFISETRWIVITFSIVMLMLAPSLMPDSVIQRVKYTFEKGQGYDFTLQEKVMGGIYIDPSASERVRSWEDAFEAYPQHPILGYGVTGWRFLDAQFIRTLIETGFLGLLAFFYLLYTILTKSREIYRGAKIPFFKALGRGFFVATIGMMTHGIGANTFIIIRIMEPYWLICGLVMSIPEIEKRETEKLAEIEAKGAEVKLGAI